MNDYVVKIIAFAKAQLKLGKPYKFGAHGPNAFDCVGLVHAAIRAAGLDATLYPLFWTVRGMVGWGVNSGALRVGMAGIERGDPFLWGDATRLDHKPVEGAGHTGFCLQPISAKHPRGKAISAFNPEKDIIIHDLLPAEGSHLAFYGYLALPYPAPEPVEPPVNEQPEPPAPSEAAIEQPDDPPTAEELQAKINAALEVLTK